jgi:hypothetical protein
MSFDILKWFRCVYSTYKAMFVLNVVGELQLVKGDHLGHPLLAGGRRVRVYVHALGHLRVGLARHDPARVVKLVSAVIGRHNVHQKDVLAALVQSAHFDSVSRKHASSNSSQGKIQQTKHKSKSINCENKF